MPRNSDFPDYKGIKVNHVNDWSAIDYHNRKSEPTKKVTSGPEPMKGVWRLPDKGTTRPPSPEERGELQRASNSEWRNRAVDLPGHTNNEIIDN